MKECILLVLAVVTYGFAFPKQETRGILDGVIRNVIEGLRPDLANLTISDQNITINETAMRANISTMNITTEDLDKFDIVELKTTLLPLRLDNLTLQWQRVKVSGLYSLEGVLDLDALQGPVDLFGEGKAELDLFNFQLEAGATFNSVDGHIQIKEITSMTVDLVDADVQLENLFEGGDLETIFETFLKFFIPEVVHDFSPQVLEMLKPNITEAINKVLAEIDFP